MIFSQLKANISKNLDDVGAYYNSTDLQNSVQDGYDDIAALTQCIVKKVTLPFTGEVYYDFKSLVPDFLAVTAIYNNNNSQWLADNVVLSELDLIREDWEIWSGTPQCWAAMNFKYTALVPRYAAATGTMDLFYWASAPAVVDINTPLIPTDLQKLIEFYSTPDLLEQAEEYTKAQSWWELYFTLIEVCSERVKTLAATDLIRLR